MDAASFDALFQRHVVRPACAAGFETWGKGLWLERDGLRAALLRTESRHRWPFAFTLVVGHSCLRDFDGRLPAPRSREPSEYPIKVPPSAAVELVRAFRYEPSNLGHHPQDVMPDRRVGSRLKEIGRALATAAPLLPERLAPAVVLGELLRHGEDAWCERRWIEDYRAHLAGPAADR